MTMPDSTSNVTLPPGWKIGGWRETSQANPAGQIVQGIVWTLTGPVGGASSVFVPYALLSAPQAVQAAFTDRINQIEAIQAMNG